MDDIIIFGEFERYLVVMVITSFVVNGVQGG